MAFEPIRVRELIAPVPNGQHEFAGDRRLLDFAYSAIAAWFDDWSIEKYESRAPNVKECEDYLKTTSGLRGQDIQCTVTMQLEALRLPSGTSEGTQEWCANTEVQRDDEDFATVQDGCEALQDGLADCWEARFDEQDNEWAWPNAPFIRFASPHHRARMGSLDAPTAGARIKVEFWLWWLENEANAEPMGNKSWLFETVKAGQEGRDLRQSLTQTISNCFTSLKHLRRGTYHKSINFFGLGKSEWVVYR